MVADLACNIENEVNVSQDLSSDFLISNVSDNYINRTKFGINVAFVATVLVN